MKEIYGLLYGTESEVNRRVITCCYVSNYTQTCSLLQWHSLGAW